MVADSRPKNSEPERSFVARFFIFLFKSLLLIAVLIAGGVLGLLGSNWVTRTNKVEIDQNSRLDSLQSEVVKQSELAQQVTTMSAEAESMTTQIGTLNEDTAALAAEVSSLSALVEAQSSQIATLTEAQTGLLDDLANAQNDVENLIETTAGLRRNLTTSAQSSSGVGESIATLEDQVSSLESSLAALQTSITSTQTVTATVVQPAPADQVAAADVAPVDLTLVRLLGHVARAKIHLLENDIASAGDAISAALELVDAATDEQVALFAPLTENLEAAQASLDNKPAASAIALDDAWDSLDALLTGK